MQKINAVDELLRGSESNAKTAFITPIREYKYYEVENYINQYGNYLIQLGLKKVSRIILMLSDRMELIFLLLSSIKIGVIPILVNKKIDDVVVKEILCETEPEYLFFDEVKNNFSQIHGKLSNFIDITNDSFQNEILNYSSSNLKSELFDNDDIAFWIYTSGSTKKPKAVMHRHGSILEVVKAYKSVIIIDTNDLIFSVSKMVHTYGLGNSLFHTLSNGAASIIHDTKSAFEVVDIITEFKPSILFTVPSIYRDILRLHEIKNIDLSCIRLCISAGEHLPVKIWNDWYEAFGKKIIDGIGTTELLTAFISNTESDIKVGSTGKLVSGFKAKIVDDNLNEVDDGIEGNIIVESKTLMHSYWSKNNENEPIEKHFMTGDRFVKDEDGYYWYRGRKNDSYKKNGRWFNSVEIEEAAKELEFITDVMVYVDINDLHTTKIIMYVEKNDEMDILQVNKELKVYMKKRLEHFKCPDEIIFVSKLPRTSTNKVKRVKIEDKYLIYKNGRYV
jgi:acyl-coenzyme A synthetase/AMP-(fatty) acid ligase